MAKLVERAVHVLSFDDPGQRALQGDGVHVDECTRLVEHAQNEGRQPDDVTEIHRNKYYISCIHTLQTFHANK